MRTRSVIAVLIVASMFVTGCGPGEPPREQVLADLAAATIVPAFERLAQETADLEDAANQLCSTPNSEDLAQARTALADARSAWSFSEPMWVGPVMKRRSWALIDWPIAIDEIEELISDTALVLDNDRLVSRIGADQRGLEAVEYLLGTPGDDATVLDQLADTRRCEYLTGIAGVIADEAAVLPDEWSVGFEDDGPYTETFGKLDGTDLDAVVNDALFLLEAMTDTELGAALGSMGRDVDTSAIVEGPSGLGAADLAQHLAGLQSVFVGTDDAPGLRPLLGDEIGDRLSDQFEAASTAVEAIDGPLRVAATALPEVAGAARDAIKSIQVTLATEVVSRLGVTIGFSDADGDSGS